MTVQKTLPDASLMLQVRPRQLLLLVRLDAHRHLGRAAEAMNISQPAATKLLQQLGGRGLADVHGLGRAAQVAVGVEAHQQQQLARAHLQHQRGIGQCFLDGHHQKYMETPPVSIGSRGANGLTCSLAMHGKQWRPRPTSRRQPRCAPFPRLLSLIHI